MLRFGRECRVNLTRARNRMERAFKSLPEMRAGGKDLELLSSIVSVCKHFEEMPRLWGGYITRCKKQKHEIAKLKEGLLHDCNFGKVAVVTTDMEAKNLASKHKQPQGYDFGLKGMSNQGFEFAYGAIDQQGKRYVATEYIDCIYEHQSSQTLDEAMGGLKLGLNLFNKVHPELTDFHMVSDKCNNFASMDQIPHIMHGNATGWDLAADPENCLEDMFWVSPTTKSPSHLKTSVASARCRRKTQTQAVGTAVAKDFGPEHGVHYGKVAEVGVDEGEIYYVIEYADGDKEDMTEQEYNYARFLATCDESDSSSHENSDDDYEFSENTSRQNSATSNNKVGRYPIDARKLHVLSWTNSAPQDGKDTLDCHFSYLKKARMKFVRHRGDIETPADIVKALSAETSTVAGTTIALVNTATKKNIGMKGKVVKCLGARTVHCYEYPKATTEVPLPCPVIRQHNNLTGAGRQETVSMVGRQARLLPFLMKTKWRSTKPSVLSVSSTAKLPRKDSTKDNLARMAKKTMAVPVKVSKSKREKPKPTEWKLAIARFVSAWSNKTKAAVDLKHNRALNCVPTDPAVTELPVGHKGWGKVFVLPRVQLSEAVLAQLRTLYKASKISPEAAAAQVHRSHPGNVAVKYYCTAARVKTFFAQLTKARKKNVDLELVGLYTELEGYASESCAALQRELESRNLKTTGKKATLIHRLERSDEGKSAVVDFAPGKVPGNGSKTVAELKVALLAVNLSTTGVKRDLVRRLDDYHESIAKAGIVGEPNVIAGPHDGASDPLPENSPQDRDETDELADIAINRTTNDGEVEADPDLDPDHFDGVDQEDLLS